MRESTASAQEGLGLTVGVGEAEGGSGVVGLGADDELGCVVGVPPPHEQRTTRMIAAAARVLGRLIECTFRANVMGEAETEPTR
jgi:hypothetical protein